MAKKYSIIGIVLLFIIAGISVFFWKNPTKFQSLSTKGNTLQTQKQDENKGSLEGSAPHPLSIQALREGEYPGSDLAVEEQLEPGSNYTRQIVSYTSEGLKIYALLTIPSGEKPDTGWPVIIFNHGYIPPSEYRTTERYIAYTDAFSRNGYIVLRSDYRGHGNSEGEARGGYGSNDYTIDILNAVGSIKRHPDADENRIGMWGHSMGGHITLRSMVVSKDIKAGVIWAGVVASYPELLYNWRRRGDTSPISPSITPSSLSNRGGSWRNQLIEQFGEPETNPAFWDSISSTAFLNDISGPLQIHHGTADTSVPVAFSEDLQKRMEDTNKESELYIYPGDDHDITANFSIAMQRSVSFFDTYLK